MTYPPPDMLGRDPDFDAFADQPSRGKPVRTALFLDFDNIYIGLQQLGQGWAERFASQPQRWISYLENELVPSDPGAGPRSLLVRRCYLNPVSFGKYRPYFTRAAFQVIDCPPLTARSKNSSDIQMVMDVLDVLGHDTHFDEFIVLSGDADFTPLMLRLRAHDRRTVMVTSGPAAQAYKAACSHVVSEDEFVEAALSWGGPPVAQRPSAGTGPAAGPSPGPVDGDDPQVILRLVRQCLADSDRPVPLAVAAQHVMSQLGTGIAERGWGGARSFSAALAPFVGPELAISTSPPPGWVFDPSRHEQPSVSDEAGLTAADPRFVDVDPELRDFIERISSVTGVPRLPPHEFAVLFAEIAADLEDGSFHPVESTKAIRDRCVAGGAIVSRAAVTFVVRGIRLAGYELPAEPGPVDPQQMSERFFANVQELCRTARLELSEEEGNLLMTWLLPTAEPAATG